MKKIIYTLFLMGSFVLSAQLDSNNKTARFEIKDSNISSPTGLELPARKKPSLTLPKDKKNPKTNISLGATKLEPFDMTQSDGLLENNKGKTPKAFTKDKAPLPKYAKDQNLGEVRTEAQYVDVKYRDHEHVDGDRIRVYVNGDIVQSDVFLGGSFKGFSLNLEEGENKIIFQALNQGDSGPNTAELHVYDENGLIISAKEWNLLTGRAATIVVIKQ